ncbi:zinc finger BED domain-containing protein RICESLEEPER 2-like protein [Tanacetum coccineum]
MSDMHDLESHNLIAINEFSSSYLSRTTILDYSYFGLLHHSLLHTQIDTLSRSSAEAEYRGVANAVAETSWIRNLLRELHTPLLQRETLVYCDNVSCSSIRVLHVPFRFQYADIFTKGLPYPLFADFRSIGPLAPKPNISKVPCEYEFNGPLFANIIQPMKEKLRKYFKEISPVITCAAALNPCFNISGVELLIEKISIDLELDKENIFFARDAKHYFNKCFKDLFDVYYNKYGSTNVSTSSTSSSFSTNTTMDSMLGLFYSLRQENTKRARSDQSSTNEVERYIGNDWINTMGRKEFTKFDILAWCKGMESQFPVLAAMARDLLSVQASTVASESTFSISGRVLSIRRTRLTLHLWRCVFA